MKASISMVYCQYILFVTVISILKMKISRPSPEKLSCIYVGVETSICYSILIVLILFKQPYFSGYCHRKETLCSFYRL